MKIKSDALPFSPARIASNGSKIMVADRSGSLLFLDWSAQVSMSATQEPLDAFGSVIKAHDEGGPITAVELNFASSGGWDPSVTLWDGSSLAVRYHLRLFDGRITALAAQGDRLLVAGADRAKTPAGTAKEDRVILHPGRLLQVASDGRSKELPLPIQGQITALVAEHDWLAAIDSGQGSRLLVLRHGQVDKVELQGGPLTALGGTTRTLFVANSSSVWSVDADSLERHRLATFREDDPRVLMLQAVNDGLYGATSKGLVHWPDGTTHLAAGRQPLSLATHGDQLLILWEGGSLEARDASTGEVVAVAKIPSEI